MVEDLIGFVPFLLVGGLVCGLGFVYGVLLFALFCFYVQCL